MQKPFRLIEPRPAPVPSAGLAASLVAWSAGPVHPLTALARGSESTRQFIFERTAARFGPGMRTGASNLHRHLLGDLRRYLAYEAAQLLGGVQGTEAVKATPSGKLYRLTAALWKFATGFDMDVTGGAALPRILKDVAPLARGVLHEKASLDTAQDKAAVLKRLTLVEAEAREELRRPPVRPSRRHSG